ncbi:unnamed protein product [Dibothriocephalus latus]|uniref:Uncharacterized protein n=1 Tax=Dibothriocephalus latus TaxID=60516 RepID=A0A3P7LK61_DIBLA|nr:unnamed protein product [Dibothriocephalus latus]
MLETLLILIFLVLLLLGGTVALLLYLSGALAPICVSTTDEVPFLAEGARFLYRVYQGSYQSVGGLFTETYALAPGCIQCGIFYDDPQQGEATPVLTHFINLSFVESKIPDDWRLDLGRDVSVMFEVYDEQTIHYIGLLDSNTEPYLIEEFRKKGKPVSTEEEAPRKDESKQDADDLEEEEEKSDPIDEEAFEKVGHADLGDFEEAEVEIIQPKDQLSA